MKKLLVLLILFCFSSESRGCGSSKEQTLEHILPLEQVIEGAPFKAEEHLAHLDNLCDYIVKVTKNLQLSEQKIFEAMYGPTRVLLNVYRLSSKPETKEEALKDFRTAMGPFFDLAKGESRKCHEVGVLGKCVRLLSRHPEYQLMYYP